MLKLLTLLIGINIGVIMELLIMKARYVMIRKYKKDCSSCIHNCSDVSGAVTNGKCTKYRSWR
jgi:hypothetical protein